MNERLNAPISTDELERRWMALRDAMAAQKIDVLVTQNNNDHMGGYVKYLTDMPATNGYPVTVVFPRDDLMTVVRQGPFDGRQELDERGDGVWRGTKLVLTTPSYAAAPHTAAYDAELAAIGLEPYAKAVIGLVGSYQFSHAVAEYLRTRFPQAQFVEASDLVDRIKVIKSPEEQEFCRRTARIQDGAMQAAFAAIRPGMTDREVAAIAQEYCHRHGSEQGIYLCASAPPGTPARFGNWHLGARRIEKGDSFSLLVETNGPGGFYTELGRSAVIGRVPQQMQDELAFVVEARQFTLRLLEPGTPSAEIWDAYNGFMRRNDRPEERRLYAHGQGYDMVERPLIRHDEPLAIAADINIVVHPTYAKDGALNWLCDNYIIGPEGPGTRLHETGEKVFEVG